MTPKPAAPPVFDPRPVALSGRAVDLVPLAMDHAADLLEAGRDESVWHYLSHAPFRSIDDVRMWIADALAATQSGSEVAFAVILRGTGRAVGSTRYIDIQRAHRGLEIGWTWISPEAQRTAVNTDCKLTLLRHAFEDLGAIRVCLKTDRRNIRSQRAIERIGARYEGTLRSHRICIDGWIRDSVYFSIVAEEWPAVRERLVRMANRAAVP